MKDFPLQISQQVGHVYEFSALTNRELLGLKVIFVWVTVLQMGPLHHTVKLLIQSCVMFLSDVYDKCSVPLGREARADKILSVCRYCYHDKQNDSATIVIIIIKRGFDYLPAHTDCSSCGIVGYQ